MLFLLLSPLFSRRCTCMISTPLIRWETKTGLARRKPSLFQSTPLTRGETLDRLGVPYWVQFQSTPLTRGETTWEITDADIGENFNPLPSHEGRLLMTWERSRRRNFNPLPSYEGRLSTSAMAQARGHFNPLPSHEGRQEREIRDQVAREFQSTPLSRGKTIRTLAIGADTFISIRSPLTRGDTVSRNIREIKRHFNPLPSHEGRLWR